MTSPSTVFSRTRFLVFLCVSLLGLSSTSLLCLALEASPPPFHDPRRRACRVFHRSHHRSRSLLRSDFLIHVLLAPLWDLMHHLLSSTSASVGSRRLPHAGPTLVLDFQILFLPLAWHDNSLPQKRGMSHAACRTIHLVSASSADGMYCVFLHCCQHCSNLSLQLFLIVFDSSIALL